MMKRGRLISWEFHNHLEWIAPGKHFVGVGLGAGGNDGQTLWVVYCKYT